METKLVVLCAVLCLFLQPKSATPPQAPAPVSVPLAETPVHQPTAPAVPPAASTVPVSTPAPAPVEPAASAEPAAVPVTAPPAASEAAAETPEPVSATPAPISEEENQAAQEEQAIAQSEARYGHAHKKCLFLLSKEWKSLNVSILRSIIDELGLLEAAASILGKFGFFNLL